MSEDGDEENRDQASENEERNEEYRPAFKESSVAEYPRPHDVPPEEPTQKGALAGVLKSTTQKNSTDLWMDWLIPINNQGNRIRVSKIDTNTSNCGRSSFVHRFDYPDKVYGPLWRIGCFLRWNYRWLHNESGKQPLCIKAEILTA